MRLILRSFAVALVLMVVGAQYSYACVAPPEGTASLRGGGWIDNPDLHKVHFGLALSCTPDLGAANLEMNYDGGHFHLESMTSASCTFTDPNNPPAGGTHEGSGVGRLNGEPATIKWHFVDSGNGGPSRRRSRGFSWNPDLFALAAAPDTREDYVQAEFTPVGSTEPPTAVSGPLYGGQIYMGYCNPQNHNETLIPDDWA